MRYTPFPIEHSARRGDQRLVVRIDFVRCTRPARTLPLHGSIRSAFQLFVLCSLLFVLFLFSSRYARAEDREVLRKSEQIEDSLVSIRAKRNGVVRDASGFVISPGGTVVTSKKLIDDVGGIDGSALFAVSSAFSDERPLTSIHVYGDLVALRLPPGRYTTVGQAISSEFLRGENFGVVSMAYDDKNIRFEEGGLSIDSSSTEFRLIMTTIPQGNWLGAPVFNAMGEVVGVGQDSSAGSLSVSPIEYVAALAPWEADRSLRQQLDELRNHILPRLKRIEDQQGPLVADMLSLKTRFQWTFSLVSGDGYRISYVKAVPGPPHIAKIKYRATVYFPPEDVSEATVPAEGVSEATDLPDLADPVDLPTAAEPDKISLPERDAEASGESDEGRTFRLTKLNDSVERLSNERGLGPSKIEVKLVGLDSSGKRLVVVSSPLVSPPSAVSSSPLTIP